MAPIRTPTLPAPATLPPCGPRAPSTQADQLAELLAAAHNVGARPAPWGLSLALRLNREETRTILDDLVAAKRTKRRHLSRDPDQPRPPFVFDQVARRHLVEHGQVPTPKAVAARAAELGANWPKIQARMAADDTYRAEILLMAPRVCALVARAREATGTAPTWSELARVFGWPFHRERTVKLSYLVKSGWLTATNEPRSLNIGPLGRCALAHRQSAHD